MAVGDWYVWRWNRPEGRKGQRCKLLAVGKRNNVLIEFEDGYKVVTGRMGLRKEKEKAS